MNPVDYLVDILLIAVVLRQIRTQRLTLASVLLPLSLVAGAAVNYVRPFHPTAHDVALIAALASVGTALGLLSAAATAVWRDDAGAVWCKAGALAAAAWVAGMGSRFAFVFWSKHSGRVDVARFSAHHGLTVEHVWSMALVSMAFAEVLARTALLQWRRRVVAATPSTDARPTALVRG